MNTKVGWGIAAVVVVLALIAFAVYDSQKAVVPVVEAPTASSTPATSTAPVAGATGSAPAVAPAAPVATTTVVSADGTTLFTAPSTFTLEVGKGAVERVSGLRVAVRQIDSKKKYVNSANPTPTVANITLNRGSCSGGYCTSEESTAQNIAFSSGQSIVYGGYNVALTSLTLTSATFTISKAL